MLRVVCERTLEDIWHYLTWSTNTVYVAGLAVTSIQGVTMGGIMNWLTYANICTTFLIDIAISPYWCVAKYQLHYNLHVWAVADANSPTMDDGTRECWPGHLRWIQYPDRYPGDGRQAAASTDRTPSMRSIMDLHPSVNTCTAFIVYPLSWISWGFIAMPPITF